MQNIAPLQISEIFGRGNHLGGMSPIFRRILDRSSARGRKTLGEIISHFLIVREKGGSGASFFSPPMNLNNMGV